MAINNFVVLFKRTNKNKIKTVWHFYDCVFVLAYLMKEDVGRKYDILSYVNSSIYCRWSWIGNIAGIVDGRLQRGSR